MKSFKDFILEAEKLSGPPVNPNQSLQLYRPGSTLPPGLKLVPISQNTKSKPNNISTKPTPTGTVPQKRNNSRLTNLIQATTGANSLPSGLGL